MIIKNSIKLVLITSLALFLVFSSFKCDSNKRTNNHIAYVFVPKDTLMSFEEKIRIIENKVVDLTSPSDLFMIDEFVRIYEQPSLYKNDVLKFISSSKSTDQQKNIAIYSMFKLNAENYLEVIKLIYNLFLNNEVKSNLLEISISYLFNEKHPIIVNYKNIEVQKLLIEIRQSDKISNNFRSSLDNILSGKRWNDIKEFRSNSGH